MNEDRILKRVSAEEIIKYLAVKKEDFWLKEQEKLALTLFKSAAYRVPAYKDFLKKNKVDPGKIVTFADFKLVPLIDKKNYLRQYPLKDLVWDGSLKRLHIFSATSGSTGLPIYFPRSAQLNWESSIFHELFFRNSSYGPASPTLVIICFGMGVWIGGLITYSAFEETGKRGNPISIITPGINKIEIFNALRNLAPNYNQIILVGYPPFIKDILDESAGQGIDLKKINLRLLFAAEAFTEKFRDYAASIAGIKNIYLDTANIYGTADIGTMAYETPASILIRRLAVKNKKMFGEFFGEIQKLPTLAQYNPLFIAFESPRDEILITGNSSIPLVRYSVGDRGGVMNFSDAKDKLKKFNVDLEREASRTGIGGCVYELPFVYVYERKDLAVKLHLRDIYPEIIRDVLVAKPFNKYFSGKFSMATRYGNTHDQYLEINLEIRRNKKAGNRLKKMLHENLLRALRTKTTGPGNPDEFIKRPNLIKTVHWPAEHPLYFKSGVKQKWVV